MPLVIAFIILVVAAFTVGDFFGVANISQVFQPQQETQQEETQAKSVSTFSPSPAQTNQNIIQKPSPQPSPTEPQIFINTDIQWGPRSKEVIDDTNKVTFEFGATVLPKDTEGEILFETKVLGLDSSWQETKEDQTTIEFPPGPKTYTFLVRAKINNLVDLTPAKRTFEINISPYYEKIEITNVRLPTPNLSSLLTLNAQIKEQDEINITGWQIKGKQGTTIIPQGIEEFNPLTKSFTLKDILIKKGDTIYISTEANPLGPNNWSFRPNRCMGYLVNGKQFPISISTNCPLPYKRLPSYLEKCCLEYISTLGSCQSPKYQDLKDYNLFEDPNCWYYITSTFSYAGCFASHYQEANFTQNQWHIYLDRTEREVMDKNCDTIYLKDKDGLLIDKYDYGQASCRYLGR